MGCTEPHLFFLTMKRILLLFSIAILGACRTHEAPLIGITCSRSSSGATLLSTTYTEAVSKAGGTPVVIPTVASAAQAEEMLAKLDGVIFSGGEDINPAWYEEEVWNETVYRDSVRDYSDSLLARAALMNVMLGGSLYQDLPSQKGTGNRHGGGAMHRIGLEEGSVLATLFGPDSLEVNSYHHQAVKEPAPGIRVTARSSEGIVEAYETNQITAVQFHPEKMLQNGEEKWLAFFQVFVKRCRP